ncbi:hypothetical protein HC891_13240 [Candidatus Gracilibacteria bacterium]|nr:hypothetical protein [Candidatus Gracilibacteria bacterium]
MRFRLLGLAFKSLLRGLLLVAVLYLSFSPPILSASIVPSNPPLLLAAAQDTPQRVSFPCLSAPAPPATYYGTVTGAEVNQPIVALVDGIVCGRSSPRSVDDQVMSTADVAADSQQPGCGASGRTVGFTIGRQTVATMARWQNAGPHLFDVRIANAWSLWLPLMRR